MGTLPEALSAGGAVSEDSHSWTQFGINEMTEHEMDDSAG
jgi:hypothetical protein